MITIKKKLVNERHVRIAGMAMVSRADAPLREWISLFGVSPKVISVLWNVTCFDHHIELIHILWALSFLKTYLTEAGLIRLTGQKKLTRTTYRKKIWSVLDSFAAKSCSIAIRWENRFRKDRGRTCKVSVDGTDIKVQRQTPHWRDKQYFSHKFKHAALRYEVAVNIQTGDIVWINGPFRAGKWPDINIFRRDLKRMLLPGEMVEADRGYRDNRCRHCDCVVSRRDARAKSRAMRRHETVNADIKNFSCMEIQWRHDLEKHATAFSSVALLVQLKYTLEGGPKFDVTY